MRLNKLLYILYRVKITLTAFRGKSLGKREQLSQASKNNPEGLQAEGNKQRFKDEIGTQTTQ